jgi:dynein light intermediate chain
MTTLVKYDNPVAMSEVQGKARALGRRNGAKLPPVESRLPPQSPEDILNTIIPPREWVEGGQPWVQFVSSTPATRLDVIHLQEQLDQRLAQRQARDLGICPVREELYAQCFDEIIRQVTVNCAERGLLLLRIRDEVRQTVGAYRTLYESSVAFGMRKALTAEQGRADTLATTSPADFIAPLLYRWLPWKPSAKLSIVRRPNTARSRTRSTRRRSPSCARPTSS